MMFGVTLSVVNHVYVVLTIICLNNTHFYLNCQLQSPFSFTGILTKKLT